MKFVFENDLPHQRAAIDAALGIFGDGSGGSQATFTVAPLEIAGQMELAEKGVGIDNVCSLDGDDWLPYVQAVQLANVLQPDDAFEGTDFTIEMETGTGKTYVYLRTIIELNRRHGFTKFVIVVPSVAIREGVKKSIEQTRDHFASQFDGLRLSDFVYDRTKLGRVREFATAADIQVMIVTIQSINSANNVFYDANQEALGDQAAADWVAKTRPILIVDEPQSVEGGLKGAGRTALKAMNPLAMFKYTATPVNVVHAIHRLDAFDAFSLGLVKRIWVDGASVKDAANSPYIHLVDVEKASGSHPVRARIEIDKQYANGPKREQIPDPATARVTWASAELLIARDGVDTGRVTYAAPKQIGGFAGPMPDILSELAARTDLPRGIVAKILVQADRLSWAKNNPAAFVELAHKAISLARRDILTQGITYERTGAHFEQTLFEPFDADEADLVAVDNAPTTHIRVDSKTIERPIAEQLDRAEPVTLFAKLPPDFKIDTPLGSYNPDWAVTGSNHGAPAIHLVSESKSDFGKLREDEEAKIRCGMAHFEALGVDFVKAVNAEDIVMLLVGTDR